MTVRYVRSVLHQEDANTIDVGFGSAAAVGRDPTRVPAAQSAFGVNNSAPSGECSSTAVTGTTNGSAAPAPTNPSAVDFVKKLYKGPTDLYRIPDSASASR